MGFEEAATKASITVHRGLQGHIRLAKQVSQKKDPIRNCRRMAACSYPLGAADFLNFLK